jgi:hypothetical protein
MLCLVSDCKFKIRVCSLLATPHGQAYAGLVLKFFFMSIRMLCHASDCELES